MTVNYIDGNAFCYWFQLRFVPALIDRSSAYLFLAVERGAGPDGQKITYNTIKQHLGDLIYRLVSQKFEDPAEGEPALVEKFRILYDNLTTGFRNLEDEYR
eukprot:Gb_06310 [translate_table: standard]